MQTEYFYSSVKKAQLNEKIKQTGNLNIILDKARRTSNVLISSDERDAQVGGENSTLRSG